MLRLLQLQLLVAFLAPRLLAMLLPRLLAILLWLLRLLLAPRLLATQPVPRVPTPRRHGQQPVHAKPSRSPLRLEPVAMIKKVLAIIPEWGSQTMVRPMSWQSF
jgi:hypothetical protein